MAHKSGVLHAEHPTKREAIAIAIVWFIAIFSGVLGVL